MSTDLECTHGGGAAFVGKECVLCGARRKVGRPRKVSMADAYALGRQAALATDPGALGPVNPEHPGRVRQSQAERTAAKIDAALGTPAPAFRPSWLRFDGRLKRHVRNPVAYKRPDDAPGLPEMLATKAREVPAAEKLRAAREALGRMSLAEFIKLGWRVVNPTNLYWSWHMQAVADHVQKMLEELLRARQDPTYRMAATNLMINIPPRCSKSMIVSVFAPAWAWLRDPTLKIRCMSANGKVANRDSRYCRELIGSAWYRDTFRIKWGIRGDVDGVELYTNTAGGERHATTFQSRITGEGTDVIIVDDPHDAEEVNSEAKRAAVLDKWDTAIESRVNDRLRCVRIGVMQRLHEADWAGHVLATGTWIHLWIAMEFEPDRRCSTRIGDWTWSDPRTEPQELLHPDRFPLRELRGSDNDNHATGGLYKTLGSYGYAGQMQQRPAPAEGGLFKRTWWRYYDEVPTKLDGVIISVDCNAKKTIDGSRTSCLVVGRRGPQRFVLDNVTRITEFEEILDIVTDLRAKWPTTSMTIIEDKANGPSVVAVLKKRLGRIEECKVGSDSKESRARAITPLVEAGDVFLPRVASWLDDFMHEVSVFPNGARDDQVDALSQALIYMEGSNDAARFRAAWG